MRQDILEIVQMTNRCRGCALVVVVDFYANAEKVLVWEWASAWLFERKSQKQALWLVRP